MDNDTKLNGPKMIPGKTLVVLTMAVLLFGSFIFFLYITPRLADKVHSVPINYVGQPRLGSKNAPVKIMEFADFNCPACKRFHDNVLPKIKQAFIKSGQAQMYFTNFQVLGESSIFAGAIGESIYHQSNDDFWKYYDLMYKNQKKKHEGGLSPDVIFDLIERDIPHVNLNKVLLDLDRNVYENVVIAESKLARKMKMKEVPALYINGKKVKNPQDYNEIKKMIKDELS